MKNLISRAQAMDEKTKSRVVIVGAGFGGLLAARTLYSHPVQITLVDRQNFHTFQPLLYQVATAGLSPGEIAAPIRWIMRSHRNVEVLMSEVQDFDLSRRLVKLDSGEIPLRLPDCGRRRQPCLLRSRRVGALRARPEDD